MDEEVKKTESSKILPKMHTLKSDATQFIEKRNVSSLDIATKEYATQKKALPQESRLWRFRIIAALATVVFVGGVVIFFFFNSSPKSAPAIQPTLNNQHYLTTETRADISFNRIDPGTLFAALNQQKNLPRQANTATLLEFSLTFREFIDFVKWNPPPAILQNTAPIFDMVSLYLAGTSEIGSIFKINNFERALSGMFEWEERLWVDWKPFLATEDAVRINTFSFRDEIVRNHDARVLTNADEKSILAYAIFNKQYIVIATSREGLSLMLQKLIAQPPR